MARVLVVDDEPEIREMISDHLRSAGYEVGQAECVNSTHKALSEIEYQLVIADILLGSDKQGGVEISESLRENGTPVVLISGNASVEALKRAINSGAKYFFEKPFDLNELEKVSRELIKSQDAFREKFEAILEKAQLTRREVEIFELLSKGMSNREIATTIDTSERTVKAHISSIFKKCHVSSRAELLSLLIDPS